LKTVALYVSPQFKNEFLKLFETLETRELSYVWAEEGELDTSLLSGGGVDIVVEALNNPKQAGKVIKAALEGGLQVVATNTTALGNDRKTYKDIILDKGSSLITSGAIWGDGRNCAPNIESRSTRMFLIPGGEPSTLLRYMRDENIGFDAAVELYAEVNDTPIDQVRERAMGKSTLKRADLMREQVLSSVKGLVKSPRGLDHIEASDILLAERMGYAIKLTADIRMDGVFVAPFLFDRNLPLAHVEDADEAVWVALSDHNRMMTYRNHKRAFAENVIEDIKALQPAKLNIKPMLTNASPPAESLYFLRGNMGLASFCRDHPSFSVVSDSLMAKEGIEGAIVRTNKAKIEIDRLTSEFGIKIYNVFQGNDTWYPL
jgi:hypothetical protein